MHVHYRYKQTSLGGKAQAVWGGCGWWAESQGAPAPNEKSDCIAMVIVYNCTTNMVSNYFMQENH